MNNPFLQTIQARVLYGGIWIISMIIQVFLFHFQSDSPLSIPPFHYYDAFICNGLQAGCTLALWYPVRYYRNIVSIPLFLLFHLSLMLISFAVWMGLGYFITSGLSNDSLYTSLFLQVLPIRIFFGVLIYILFVLVYYLQLAALEIKEQKMLLENAKADSASTPEEKITRISIKKKQEIHLIPVHQIYYIEANGDYVLIHTVDKKYLKDRTMKYWETHLPEENFVRIHRSYIVNTEFVAKIELYEKEIYKVQLKNGDSLKVSTTGYKLLKQKMQL
jgi:hypothetical protein